MSHRAYVGWFPIKFSVQYRKPIVINYYDLDHVELYVLLVSIRFVSVANWQRSGSVIFNDWSILLSITIHSILIGNSKCMDLPSFEGILHHSANCIYDSSRASSLFFLLIISRRLWACMYMQTCRKCDMFLFDHVASSDASLHRLSFPSSVSFFFLEIGIRHRHSL